jgi:hypothetical protein
VLDVSGSYTITAVQAALPEEIALHLLDDTEVTAEAPPLRVRELNISGDSVLDAKEQIIVTSRYSVRGSALTKGLAITTGTVINLQSGGTERLPVFEAVRSSSVPLSVDIVYSPDLWIETTYTLVTNFKDWETCQRWLSVAQVANAVSVEADWAWECVVSEDSAGRKAAASPYELTFKAIGWPMAGQDDATGLSGGAVAGIVVALVVVVVLLTLLVCRIGGYGCFKTAPSEEEEEAELGSAGGGNERGGEEV